MYEFSPRVFLLFHDVRWWCVVKLTVTFTGFFIPPLHPKVAFIWATCRTLCTAACVIIHTTKFISVSLKWKHFYVDFLLASGNALLDFRIDLLPRTLTSVESDIKRSESMLGINFYCCKYWLVAFDTRQLSWLSHWERKKQIKLKMRHYGNKSVEVLLFTAPFLISVLLGSEWVLGSWLELNADTDISGTVVCIWAQKKKKKERNSYTFKKSIIFECQCSI